MIGRTCGLAAVLALAAAALSLVAPEPGAANHFRGTCEYVEAGPPGVAGNQLELQVRGGTPIISREGERITIGNRVCEGPAPTIHNIDQVVIRPEGSRSLELDLAGGPLAPGASERGPGADIEVYMLETSSGEPSRASLSVTTGKRAGVVVQGRSSGDELVNLNPKRERRKDADVFLEEVSAGSSKTNFYMGGGDDIIDLRGTGVAGESAMLGHVHPGNGDDKVFASDLSDFTEINDQDGNDLHIGGDRGGFFGGERGRDRLRGGAGPDVFAPGGGRDKVVAGRGADVVRAVDEMVDEIRCGPGRDEVIADREDRLRDCESVERR